MSELEILWERLRVINRSLDEEKKINLQDYYQSKSYYLDEVLMEERVSISAKQEQLNEVMEIIEGMIEDAKD